MSTEYIEYNGYKIKVWQAEDGWHSYSKVSSPVIKNSRNETLEATQKLIDENSKNPEQHQSGIRQIFAEMNENFGGDDVSLESALKASARIPHEDDEQYETVVIDGDEYEFKINPEEKEKSQFVAITSIGAGTGYIFLAEGTTEEETRDKGLDAILPEDVWKYANIYDVTKRQNMRIINISKARQLGYRGYRADYSDMVEDEDFGAY